MVLPPVKGHGKTARVLHEYSPSVTQFLEEWEPEDPPTIPKPVTHEVLVIGRKATRVRRRRVIAREWDKAAPPGWFLTEIPAWPEGGNPFYLRPLLQVNVFMFAGRRPEDEPLFGYTPNDKSAPWTFEPFRAKALELLRFPPSVRYERLNHLIVQYEKPGGDFQRTGMELWEVVENAYHAYHPFPRTWLQEFDYLGPSPAFCFYAFDYWVAAFAELAWAIQNDVYGRPCRVTECGTWFLHTGRQGARKEFCTYHRQHGGAQGDWRGRFRKLYPDAWRSYEARRHLAARRRRGSISQDEFRSKDMELLRKLAWYEQKGLAPKGAGRRAGPARVGFRAGKQTRNARRGR
jgi:hypothetical protein